MEERYDDCNSGFSNNTRQNRFCMFTALTTVAELKSRSICSGILFDGTALHASTSSTH